MSKDVYSFTREDFRTALTKIIRAAPIEKNLYDGLITAFHAIINNHLDLILDGKKIPEPEEPEKQPKVEGVESVAEVGSGKGPSSGRILTADAGEVEPEEEKKKKDSNSGPSSLEG